MAALPEPPVAEAIPRLLVDLPSWPRIFFGNLRDLLFPNQPPHLEIKSAPAPFWPDVFVRRPLPWSGFFQSIVCHFAVFALIVAFTRFFALQPRVVAAAAPVFDHSQVVYYQASEYLPPLDTRAADPAPPKAPDPEFSRQPIISVPPEADNRSQTIVTPPQVKLKHNVPLPNIVAWADKPVKPRLDIPAAPVVNAAEIARLAPRVETAVVTPPPDAAHLPQRRDQPNLQASVVAPPPSVEAAQLRSQKSGDLNIGHSDVIAPAPELAVAEQRALPGGNAAMAGTAQVVPPPPSLAAAGSSGSPGRMIALSLHPTVGAPPDPPTGNRRGAFAATPEGHAGASGSPGSSGGASSSAGPAGASARGSKKSDLPAGLYVGVVHGAPSAVAGDPAPRSMPSPDPAPSMRPRVAVTPAIHLQPGNSALLSAPERGIFGARRFYSLNLSLPNLNSGGGSWIVRFSELKPDSEKHGAEYLASNAPEGEITAPKVTRTVDPAYPLNLMRANVSGTVILYAIIHADGTVSGVRVLQRVDPRLDRFAAEAIAQWKFDPATKNGAPVDVEATFQIPFRPTQVGTSF
jgi:TonB family protein